jgi:ubiquinone/menaquinone biosynthesis C-methylase UbiE
MPELGEGHPIFAAVWSRFGHQQVRAYRAPVVGGARGHVLELGAGSGENLATYRSVESITLTEPDPYMLRRAEAKVRQSGLPVDLVPAVAEQLPFPDQSFDTVVATLVFCSVEDQAAAFAEIRRVLKPGGTLRFLEHVRSEVPVRAWLQDVSMPIGKWFGGGCRSNRDTLGTMRRSGFEFVDLLQVDQRGPVFAGVARVR